MSAKFTMWKKEENRTGTWLYYDLFLISVVLKSDHLVPNSVWSQHVFYSYVKVIAKYHTSLTFSFWLHSLAFGFSTNYITLWSFLLIICDSALKTYMFNFEKVFSVFQKELWSECCDNKSLEEAAWMPSQFFKCNHWQCLFARLAMCLHRQERMNDNETSL